MMLPASAFAEITANLATLHVEPNTAAQILAAVFAPLLRNSRADPVPDPEPKIRRKRARRPRLRSRGAGQKRKKSRRRALRSTEARQRAARAIAANPNATLARIAEIAKCGYGTVVNARKDLAAEARKRARKEARKSRETMSSTPIGGSTTAKPPSERRQRAQQFLKDTLARGPKRATDVEEAAAKAHINDVSLEQARTALGIVASRANTGGAQAVQWSLPAP